jgi:hypothetical protein
MTTVEVSVQTLMVALQVLGAEMSRIEELLVSDPGEPDLQQGRDGDEGALSRGARIGSQPATLRAARPRRLG